MAIVEDSGGYSGIVVAAHELGMADKCRIYLTLSPAGWRCEINLCIRWGFSKFKNQTCYTFLESS